MIDSEIKTRGGADPNSPLHLHDGFQSGPSHSRNSRPFYFKKAGRCTRCHGLFSGNTAFMVGETVVWQVLVDVAFTQREVVPVCVDCVEVAERSLSNEVETKFVLDRRSCPSCSLILLPACRDRNGSLPRGRFCSERCEQRARRKRKAAARPIRFCGCCGTSFKPRRADAFVCSSACRQALYRRRAALNEQPQRVSI